MAHFQEHETAESLSALATVLGVWTLSGFELVLAPGPLSGLHSISWQLFLASGPLSGFELVLAPGPLSGLHIVQPALMIMKDVLIQDWIPPEESLEAKQWPHPQVS